MILVNGPSGAEAVQLLQVLPPAVHSDPMARRDAIPRGTQALPRREKEMAEYTDAARPAFSHGAFTAKESRMTLSRYANLVAVLSLLVLAGPSPVRAEYLAGVDEEKDGAKACADCGAREGWLSRIWNAPNHRNDCCRCRFVPNMIGDSFGVPRVGGIATDFLNFPTHLTKAADNNNVHPYDRISFAYNLYHDVPTTFTGDPSIPTATGTEDTDISEFRLLVEKTLFDGVMSLNLILPMYHTIAFQQTAGTLGAEGSEFGDLAFGLKILLWETQTCAISTGLQFEAPTARALGFVGSDLIRNEAWYLSPYVGALWTPNDRLFSQSFLSYRARTGANPTDLGAEFATQDLLFIDSSLGYWMRKREGRGITGIAPVAELHYSTTTEDDALGSYTREFYGSREMLNLTAGTVFELRERHTLSLGMTLPLNDNPLPGGLPTDRAYDWELAVQLNMYR
jgi:hypothetical protein